MAETGEGGPAPTSKKIDPVDKPLWLTAWRDHLAGVRAFSPCLDMCDIHGDGDYKLVIADASKKLKIFSGTCLVSEGQLLDIPVSVVCYSSADQAKPLVAVAYGPFVFIYRSLKPFYKFNLQPLDLCQEEKDMWEALAEDKATIPDALEKLEQLKEDGSQLSNRSMDFLALETEEERAAFVASVKDTPLVQLSVFTCMAVLNKDTDGGVGCLVLGTESGRLLILDKFGAQVQKKVQLPSVPVHLITSGVLDVEYRIVVACRNGHIYVVKNGELRGTVMEVESQTVAMCRVENQIVVGTMGGHLHFYNLKGSKQTTLTMPSPVTNMCSLTQENVKQAKAFVVALANGEVRVYVGKSLLNRMNVHDVVTAMKVGKYGREDSTLVLILKSGAVVVNMLPRTASLSANAVSTHGAPPEQDVPLKVPKRTTLYVEMTQREKEFGVDMHRVFQRDLCKLRLQTARAYVKILTDGQGTQNFSAQSSLRLTAHVQGLGPLFSIKLNVQNTGQKALINIPVVFTFNGAVYRMPRPHLMIPVLVPALVYTFEVAVECIDEGAGTDVVRVYVCDPRSSAPIITALVNMPLADFLMANQ